MPRILVGTDDGVLVFGSEGTESVQRAGRAVTAVAPEGYEHVWPHRNPVLRV